MSWPTREMCEARRPVPRVEAWRRRPQGISGVRGRQPPGGDRLEVPVYSARHGLASQVAIGVDEGLKHESALHCDELVSLPKTRLTGFVGRLSPAKLRELDRALAAALDIDVENLIT